MQGDDALSDVRTIVLVAEDAQAIAAQMSASANGLHIVQVRFADAATAMRDQVRPAAAFIDLRGAAPAAIANLAGVVGAAETLALPLVVAFDVDLLDEVGGRLLGSRAALLCEPDALELTAALAMAINDPDQMVRDGSREALRLQRLNEEVARFAATLAKLSTQEDVPLGRAGQADPFVADRSPGFGTEPAHAEIDPAEVRRAIRARRLRDDAFDLPGLFEDPAWDMLLDLFAAELERRRVSVSSLCIAAAVAPTTALRWIGKLIDAGLLDRRADEFDRRRAFLSLTARASTAMRNYLAALGRAGLTIA